MRSGGACPGGRHGCAVGQGADFVRYLRVGAGRQVVADAGQDDQAGAVDRGGGASARGRADQGVGRAVQDEGRYPELG